MFDSYFCSNALYPTLCSLLWTGIVTFGVVCLIYWLLSPRIRKR